MADNTQDNPDEYKFDDLDLLASEPEDALSTSTESTKPTPEPSPPFDFMPLVKKGLIGLGVVIAIIILLQLVLFLTSGKPTKSSAQIIPVDNPIQSIKPILVTPIASQPTTSPLINVNNSRIADQLSALLQQQQTNSAAVTSLSSGLDGVGSAMSELSVQLKQVNQLLSALNDKMELQAQEMQALHTQLIHVKSKQHAKRAVGHSEKVKYALQAIIPGRAWLIASNGTTMTVREGSLVTGYGIVKSINAEQGRVMLSSGDDIRFSQADS